MKYRVFSVYDDKAKAYLTPFFLPEVGQALRAFGDAVNDPRHEFGRHAADYTLFLLGTWDIGSGRFEIMDAFTPLTNGLQLREFEQVAARLNGGGKPVVADVQDHQE